MSITRGLVQIQKLGVPCIISRPSGGNWCLAKCDYRFWMALRNFLLQGGPASRRHYLSFVDKLLIYCAMLPVCYGDSDRFPPENSLRSAGMAHPVHTLYSANVWKCSRREGCHHQGEITDSHHSNSDLKYISAGPITKSLFVSHSFQQFVHYGRTLLGRVKCLWNFA